MTTVTFAFDCQLNDQEDWIAEGTIVQVSENFYHNKEGFVPVLITDCFTYHGRKREVIPFIEWFSVGSFRELQ